MELTTTPAPDLQFVIGLPLALLFAVCIVGFVLWSVWGKTGRQ